VSHSHICRPSPLFHLLHFTQYIFGMTTSSFVIGLAPLIPVVLVGDGGTNQQLQNSVELLQSNNLALNNTNNATCAQLETTTLEWIKTNAFEISPISGRRSLHVLSLTIEPVRCRFQYIRTARKMWGHSLLWHAKIPSRRVIAKISLELRTARTCALPGQ